MQVRETPPFAPVLMESTRAIGYSLEAAIAYIIDNSIAAKAGKVIIDLSEDNVASVRNEKDILAADEAASSAYAESLNGSGEVMTDDAQSTQTEENTSEPSGADIVG